MNPSKNPYIIRQCSLILLRTTAIDKYGLSAAEIEDLNNYKYILETVASQPSMYEMNESSLEAIVPYASSKGISEGIARGILENYGYTFDPRYELPEVIEERTDKTTQKETDFFEVFPNPTTGIINFTINNDLIDYLSISTLDGKLLMRTAVAPPQSVDLSGLISGTYVLKIVSQKGKVYHQKVTIIK